MKLFVFSFLFFGIIGFTKAQSAEPERADTICLRDVCSYCEVGNYAYNTHPFSKYYYCLCLYGLQLNLNDWYVIEAKHAQSVKVLLLENPSKFISHIGWKAFTQLEEVEMWGNDIDFLNNLPEKMLQISTLKSVKISSISMETSVWKEYQSKFPKIKFEVLN